MYDINEKGNNESLLDIDINKEQQFKYLSVYFDALCEFYLNHKKINAEITDDELKDILFDMYKSVKNMFETETKK